MTLIFGMSNKKPQMKFLEELIALNHGIKQLKNLLAVHIQILRISLLKFSIMKPQVNIKCKNIYVVIMIFQFEKIKTTKIKILSKYYIFTSAFTNCKSDLEIAYVEF